MSNLETLQQALGLTFNGISFLTQALVHSSYVNENPEFAPESNERLEFLGDAVLGLVVAEKLYRSYPSFTEGEMTKLRAAVICRECLDRIARNLNLGDYLYLGKGEDASGGRGKPANLASAVEAIIAAIYLDQGLAVAQDFILRQLGREIEEVVQQGRAVDYKSELQELVQAREQRTPRYYVIEEAGPDHGKLFTAEVKMGETTLGRGSGKSKKEAESQAARDALEKLTSGG